MIFMEILVFDWAYLVNLLVFDYWGRGRFIVEDYIHISMFDYNFGIVSSYKDNSEEYLEIEMLTQSPSVNHFALQVPVCDLDCTK